MVEQREKFKNIYTFTPDEIETYVRILAHGFHTKKLTFNGIREELKDIMLLDRDGTLWTVGIGSGAWYRYEEGKWLKSIPPGELFSAHNVIKSMKAGTGECPACHSRVPQGYRFCPQCGKPMTAETKDRTAPPPAARPVFCRKCGKELQGAAKFCTHCGTPRRP